MAPSSDDKGKRPREEDPKLKEEQEARKSRARNSTFVGSTNSGRAFSHDLRGPTFPVLDLNFMPVIKKGMLVTNELLCPIPSSREGDRDTSRRESQASQDTGTYN
jgi:hypothetical protein